MRLKTARSSASLTTVRQLRSFLMTPAYQALCLVVLLVAGQQGALLHEIGHLAELGRSTETPSQHATEPACALCPAYAQAATPAFDHSFVLPSLVLVRSDEAGAPPIRMVGAAVPTPRSRGPPAVLD